MVLVALLFLNVVDLEMTRMALNMGAIEGNPIVRWVINSYGMTGVWVFKIGAWALMTFFVLVWKMEPRWAQFLQIKLVTIEFKKAVDVLLMVAFVVYGALAYYHALCYLIYIVS